MHQLRRQTTRVTWLGQTHFLRVALIVSAVIAGFGLGLLVLTLGPKLVNSWRESRWLRQAEANLKRGEFNDADNAAQQALQINRDSLAAYQILAEATEKQNRAETVVWRTQIARLRPHDIDSQLNLASAALRFGQLDAARKALDAVPKQNRESAPYHVVAGWLARAQGDEAGQERHFAAALEKEPGNETPIIRDAPGENSVFFELNDIDDRSNVTVHAKLMNLNDKFPLDSLRLRIFDDNTKGNDQTVPIPQSFRYFFYNALIPQENLCGAPFGFGHDA